MSAITVAQHEKRRDRTLALAVVLVLVVLSLLVAGFSRPAQGTASAWEHSLSRLSGGNSTADIAARLAGLAEGMVRTVEPCELG